MWLYLTQIVGRLIKPAKKIIELRAMKAFELERMKIKQVNHWKKTKTITTLLAAKVERWDLG